MKTFGCWHVEIYINVRFIYIYIYIFFNLYMTVSIWLINDEGKLINLLVCMESIFRIGLEEEERKS